MRHRYMYELVCIRYEPNSYLYLLDIDTEQFKLRKQRTLAPEKSSKQYSITHQYTEETCLCK